MTEIKSLTFVLKDSQLQYILPPKSQILVFKWKCCVKSICIKYLQNVESFVSLSSNIVCDIKFNEKAQVETFNPSLVQFLLKGKKNETKFIDFEPIWFLVNNPSEQIKLYATKIFDSEASITSEVQMEFSVFFLLQKIE